MLGADPPSHDGGTEREGANIMAYADYRLCDVCGGKAFYDAELQYDNDTSKPPFRVAGKPANYPHVLGYLGDWAVLCRDCAKKYKTQIVPIDQAPKGKEQTE